MFILSFNVTDRSPTNVTCSIDGYQFNISDNDLIRTVIRREDNTDPGLSILVQVSVMFRIRVAGLYQCTVTTDRITSTPLTATTPAAKNITGKDNKCYHYYCFLFNSNWVTIEPDIQYRQNSYFSSTRLVSLSDG